MSLLSTHEGVTLKPRTSDPYTFRAPPRDAFFITVIVKAPVIQIISILLAGFIIALEFPVPYLRGTKLHRTIALRIPLLLVQAFFAVLFYQVSPCLFVLVLLCLM